MTMSKDSQSSPFDLLTVGEPMICLTSPSGRLESTQTLVKSVVGAEANVAIGLARLGRSVAMVSKVGSDPFGSEIVRTLRGEGVDVGWVRPTDDAPTGMMVKEQRRPDDVHGYYYRSGSAASLLSAGDVPDSLAGLTRRVHVTGITLALGDGPREAVASLVRNAAEQDVPVSFDPNFRLKLWSIDEAARACAALLPDVSDLLVGEDELLAMATASGAKPDLDDALAWLDDFDLASIVVKRGADGVVGVEDGVRYAHGPQLIGGVVDTVGAGDAFNTGFLHETMSGGPFEAALHTGSWVAGHVVSHRGDYEGLPTAVEYAAFRRSEEAIHR